MTRVAARHVCDGSIALQLAQLAKIRCACQNGRPEQARSAQEPLHDILQAAGRVHGRVRPPEVRDRQEDPGQDMEAHGQGGETVPAPEDEPEELAAVHPGHPPRHLPAAEAHLLEVRGQNGGAALERTLQHIHSEPDAEVQAGDETVQGGQGEDVRRELALQAQPDET